MNEAVALLKGLMDAVALRAHEPVGGDRWNDALDRLMSDLAAAVSAAQPKADDSASGVLHFRIQDDEVILGSNPIWELRGWLWTQRLSRRGIRSISVRFPVERSALENFVVDLEAVLAGQGVATEVGLSQRWGGLRFILDAPDPGASGLPLLAGSPEIEAVEGSGRSRTAPRDGLDVGGAVDASAPSFPARAEFEVARWILGEVGAGNGLPLVESEALVRTISVGVRCHGRGAIRLLDPIEDEDYPATHAINSALLSMLLAEERGMNSREVWEVGLAGLLHDVGMTQLSRGLVQRPDALTPTERELVNTHPKIGARILLEGPEALSIPALVAYEHHLRADGGGYPARAGDRRPHMVSQLVHVVSVYCALRASRPYSAPWSHSRALTFIRAGAGGQFDENLARDFLRFMERWTPRSDPSVRGESPAAGSGDGGREAPR
ncbi:MAG: HD domain-containing protein [Gemmatimonadales bacterium]|nr:MAG: HD domain-containing protein [Gemmatimonadales bacterium]